MSSSSSSAGGFTESNTHSIPWENNDLIGPERVALVNQAMAGQAGDHMAYARAILQGSATRKRQAASSDAQTRRIGQMAAIVDTMISGLHQGVVRPYVSRVNQRMASVAPPLRVYGPDGKKAPAATQAAMDAFSLSSMWETDERAWSHTITSMDMARSSLWRVASYISKANGTADSLIEGTPLGQKRDASRPTTMGLIGRGLAGALSVTKDLVTGAAWRNATGAAGGAMTSVAWSVRPSRAQYYGVRAWNGPVTVAGRPTFWGERATAAMKQEADAYRSFRARMQVASQAVDAMGTDARRNPLERSRRLQAVRDALQSIWGGARQGSYAYTAASGAVQAADTPFNTTCLINNTVLCNECFMLGTPPVFSMLIQRHSSIRRVLYNLHDPCIRAIYIDGAELLE